MDSDTNWYTVSSFRQLAANAAGVCRPRGQRVIVTGRLRVRDWVKDDKKGLSIDVEAEAIGHDPHLGHGTRARTIVSALEAFSAVEGIRNRQWSRRNPRRVPFRIVQTQRRRGVGGGTRTIMAAQRILRLVAAAILVGSLGTALVGASAPSSRGGESSQSARPTNTKAPDAHPHEGARAHPGWHGLRTTSPTSTT